jgi:dihydrofolate reductase
MRIILIAAVDERGGIGRGNAMPWRLRDDSKRFRHLTMAKPVAMGRRTAVSIGRALDGRRNLVVTRSETAPFPGQEACGSLEDAIGKAAADGADELIVAGGGEIYALALPIADGAYVTWVETVIADADTFFPEFPTQGWREVTRERHEADEGHTYAFTFADYVRDHV